jgi:hypothetical protein
VDEPRSLGELFFGKQRPGGKLKIPVKVDFARVELTTPVLPPPHPGLPRLVKRARVLLREGVLPKDWQVPLPDAARIVHSMMRDHLTSYVDVRHQRADRLYVLEFQGPNQYVMFGRTTNLPERVAEHCRAAEPHGYALLNGWASPWVVSAKTLETAVLRFGGWTGSGYHHRERFYGMPYKTGLNLARAAFELLTDWRSRTSEPVPCLPPGNSLYLREQTRWWCGLQLIGRHLKDEGLAKPDSPDIPSSVSRRYRAIFRVYEDWLAAGAADQE